MTAALKLDSDDLAVTVLTTDRRGFTPEEISLRCADKIVSVSDSAHPAIREQAVTFKAQVAKVVEVYLKEAVRSDRTTVYNAIMDAGNPELAELIRRL
jgi:hypothetical protein